MTELMIQDNLPARPDAVRINGLLEALMWVTGVEYNYSSRLLVITGIIKPDLSLTTPSALRTQFMTSFNGVIEILEQVRANFYNHPDLMITGYANHQCCEPDHANRFGNMKAQVTIRLIG